MIFQCFSKISKIVRKNVEIFDPENFRKYFSGEEFFDFKNVLNFLGFFIRTVIKKCFSLCLANVSIVPTFSLINKTVKIYRVTAEYQRFRYIVKKREGAAGGKFV